MKVVEGDGEERNVQVVGFMEFNDLYYGYVMGVKEKEEFRLVVRILV